MRLVLFLTTDTLYQNLLLVNVAKAIKNSQYTNSDF